jgi:hypothetical protein
VAAQFKVFGPAHVWVTFQAQAQMAGGGAAAAAANAGGLAAATATAQAVGASPGSFFTPTPPPPPTSTPASKSLYLGTTERSPIIEWLPEYVPLYADSTMRRIPYDHAAAGMHALIRADNLNRFDPAALAQLLANVGALSEGTLLQLEKRDLALALVFSFGGSYTFPSCTLVSPASLAELCATAAKPGLVFHAIEDQNGVLYQ